MEEKKFHRDKALGNIRLDYCFVFPSSGERRTFVDICAIINNEKLLSHGWTRTISS